MTPEDSLPPLPPHPEVHSMTWTEMEKEAIRAYGRQCRQAPEMPASVREAFDALVGFAETEPGRPSMQCVAVVFDWLRSAGIVSQADGG